MLVSFAPVERRGRIERLEEPSGMSVAHDLDALEEQKRREAARRFVDETAHRLYELRRKTALLEAGDFETWEQAGALARELVRAGTALDLGLLVACAKEVLHFATRRPADAPTDPNLVLYLLTGLDTLGMELERLRHDKDLR
jgi:hypothetical protein